MANWWIGFLVLLMIGGCTPVAVSPTVVVTRTTPTAPPTVTSTPLFADPMVSATATLETAEATAATPPTLTVEPSLEPQPTVVGLAAVCPQSDTPPNLVRFTNPVGLRSSVLVYLNGGGTLLSLAEQLTAMEYVMGFMAEADVDGDGVTEGILTVDFTTWKPSGELDGEHTATWILRCEAGSYQIAFEEVDDDPLNHLRSPIVTVNLDHDLAMEIILEWNFDSTAGGWSAQVIDWVEGSAATHWLEWPMPNELFAGRVDLKFEDLNGDGIQEIIAAGPTPTHLMGGLTNRDIVRIYGFDGYNWRIVSTEYLPSIYRHHVLADGQRAFDDGNLELAAQFFDQAAHDDTLTSADSNFNITQDIQPFQDFPDEYQRAFALFRLMIVQIALGEKAMAENTFAELGERYPNETRGGEFTQLAALYKAEVESGKSFGQACAAVTQFTLDTFPYLGEHIGYWGWLNMGFTNETHCPYKPE
jgi:hypothetical protein